MPPYSGTAAAKLNGHLNGPVPSVRWVRQDVAPEIDDVVQRAMAKDPAARFPSAGDLARALAAAHAGVPNHEPEHSVATGRALTGIPTLADPVTRPEPTEPLTTESLATEPLPAATRRDERPREPDAGWRDATPPQEPRPPRRRAVLAGSALALFAAGATAAVLATGSLTRGDTSDPDGRAARASEQAAPSATPTATPARRQQRQQPRSTPEPTPSATATSEPAPAATPDPAPAKASLGYAAYVPDSGSYSAMLPTRGGWSVAGERELNPGLLRTTVVGPEGAELWIDVTPAEPPGFSTSSVDLISDRRLSGGLREIVFTGGGPDFCETDSCVDYQLDLGDGGIAVLARPGVQARAVARRVATSLEPQL